MIAGMKGNLYKRRAKINRQKYLPYEGSNMKKFIAGGLCLTFVGCSPVPVIKTYEIGVDFDWAAQNKCSKISPPIRLTNVPDGTTNLMFKLEDLSLRLGSLYHGGGSVAYDGNNYIAAGALKKYRGPCGKQERNELYEISVIAYDVNTDPIGTGRMAKNCCASYLLPSQ